MRSFVLRNLNVGHQSYEAHPVELSPELLINCLHTISALALNERQSLVLFFFLVHSFFSLPEQLLSLFIKLFDKKSKIQFQLSWTTRLCISSWEKLGILGNFI